MTDNEIIKALECCIDSSHFGDCFELGCPIASADGCDAYEDDKLLKSALDLITRQKAEIERLGTATEEAVACYNRMESLYHIKCVELKVAKAEAIKEFAERVSEMITEVYNKHIFGYSDLSDKEKDAVINFSDDVSSGVENLVKEITEGTDGES